MFALSLLIGIYSYSVFVLGLLGILYPNFIFAVTLCFAAAVLLLVRKERIQIGLKTRFARIIFFIFLLQSLVNLIGVLGPELSFDALWYHLTLPKIYLSNHSIFYIPGGLLYYSVMPKLTEMLYIPALAFNSEVMAKFVHFLFGILTAFAIYKISRKYFDQKIALLAGIIFYSNLVVAWESITAYIDLARTFFEVMALWGFLNWMEKKERKWLLESAVMLGLAISTKLLAIGSIFIFLALLVYGIFKERKETLGLSISILIYFAVSISIALPWFVFAFVNTGNPVYPLFTNAISTEFERNLSDIWIMFTRLSDPISPLYIIFLPLALFLFKGFREELRVILIYCILAILVWYVTPKTGGGRFILPYLPAFSLVSAAVIHRIRNYRDLQKICISLVIFFSIFSIAYRGLANARYLPVITGGESKSEFLSKNLNFNYGDFYDTDDYFKNNIKKTDKVLLYGFHNLYYVNFPFIDSSWVKRGDRFNYIATQNSNLPDRFRFWNLIYQNRNTNVKLYSQGGQTWIY